MNHMLLDAKPESGISVVMCTYNGGRYLHEQLQSIRRQTRLPAELVVCDDGSTDQTLSILHEFAAAAPFAVRIVHNSTRMGSTANFDQAIRLAQGAFIALCDQDDRWKPEKLERLGYLLEKDRNLGGVFSNASLIGADSETIGGDLFAAHCFLPAKQRAFREDPVSVFLKHCVVCGATLMFRSSLRQYIPLIPRSWVHDAWLAWMIVLHSRLEFTTEALIDYRVHAGQQIGVGGALASAAAPTTRESWREHYRRVAGQYLELRNYLIASGAGQWEKVLGHINRKIAFLEMEAGLSTIMAVRTLEIVRRLPEYLRYTRGLGAIRDDTLMD
ncbi:MAG TPA: glycosyltransferase family 2 protein [Terracidiphilus sp.]|nr:glycosyltransferase family 2 protein [Terracidiphilus sp.]